MTFDPKTMNFGVIKTNKSICPGDSFDPVTSISRKSFFSPFSFDV